MLPKDSIANTFLVSIVLCVVCSLLVSSAAVVLKPFQVKNKELDRQGNIIAAAGLGDPDEMSGDEIEAVFEQRITKQLVELESGEYVDEPDEKYDARKAAKDPKQQVDIEGEFDIGLANREPKAWVYIVKDEAGKLDKVVLPVYGMGLWSTLYGYVAVDKDLRTIKGLTYYQHGETPGLGGEVDNPNWKAKWVDRKIWEKGSEMDDSNLKVGVAKGSPTAENAPYQVDGLSGATITSKGVDSMLKYWFSDNGFGPYLDKLASQQGASDGNSDG